jgi:F1F0 ATPase subunit 2
MLLTFAAGALLGALFFGGLWWTVRRGSGSRQPALWFFGSFLLRTGVVLTSLYFVGRDHWERLIVCLIGFVTARLIVTWLTRSSRASPAPATPEVRHAP